MESCTLVPLAPLFLNRKAPDAPSRWGNSCPPFKPCDPLFRTGRSVTGPLGVRRRPLPWGGRHDGCARLAALVPPTAPSRLQGNGPLAEIDLWRERNATLSALTEQLKLPTVQKALEVLRAADAGILDNLDIIIAELSKHHVEAVDNVRFLSTLERHLKVRGSGRRREGPGAVRGAGNAVFLRAKQRVFGCWRPLIMAVLSRENAERVP